MEMLYSILWVALIVLGAFALDSYIGFSKMLGA